MSGRLQGLKRSLGCRVNPGRNRAFSLVELMLVMAVIAILAALLLPAIDKARARSKRARCVGHLNQIGVAFHSFGHDHDDKFPQSVPIAGGGVQEFAAAAVALQDLSLVPRIFRALSNELVTPDLLVCPSSRDRERFASPTFVALTNGNVSYFVGLNAVPYNTDSWLAGDSWGTAAGTLVSVTADVRWLRTWSFVHQGRCNILFADGHVESLSPSQMVSELSTAQLLVQPAAGVGSGAGGGTSGSGNAGSAGGNSVSGTGYSYPGASATAPSGTARSGGGSGTRSGFNSLENYFQQKSSSSSSAGSDGGTATPSAVPAPNQRPSEAAPSEVQYVLAAPSRETNRSVRQPKSSHLGETQAVTEAHNESTTAVTVIPLLGISIQEGSSWWKWWLALASLAIIAGIIIGTRPRRRRRRAQD